jgi:hypothetical protein
LSSMHEKWQLLFGPQLQLPFAHSPLHEPLSPSQATWHGPALQVKLQELPAAQLHSPLAQVPVHCVPWSQLT